MAEIVHLKSDVAEEDILSVIDRDAAVILDDVINTDLLNQIKDELDPYLNNYIKGKTEFKTNFSNHLLSEFDSQFETVIDSVFPFESIAEAHTRMENNLNTGKIIIDIA